MKKSPHRPRPGVYTARDLCVAALTESDGFGYFGHETRRPALWAEDFADPYACVREQDELVAACVCEMGWNAAAAAQFLNSRLGRHMGDAIGDLGLRGASLGDRRAEALSFMRQFRPE